MINHRGPEFKDLITRAAAGLKQVFQTKNDVLILTASGTGGMEAAVVNTLSPGDKVLAVSIGSFGDRFAQIAEKYGAQVTRLSVPWGNAVDPQQIREALRKDAGIKAVLVTHNETSTGVTNDIKAISQVVKGEFDKLFIVDSVSGVSAIPLLTDEWKIDVAVSGSQKGWMVPPGFAFLAVSERGWKAVAETKTPRFYFDLAKHKASLAKGETPWTPAVAVMFGLAPALDMILKEGLPNVFARHERIGKKTRDGVKALGLSLLADERYASNTVTAVKVPEGVDGKKITKVLREDEKVVVAGGQGQLEGKIFRIGHMGYVSEQDIDDVLRALKAALPRLGYKGSTAAAPRS